MTSISSKKLIIETHDQFGGSSNLADLAIIEVDDFFINRIIERAANVSRFLKNQNDPQKTHPYDPCDYGLNSVSVSLNDSESRVLLMWNEETLRDQDVAGEWVLTATGNFNQKLPARIVKPQRFRLTSLFKYITRISR